MTKIEIKTVIEMAREAGFCQEHIDTWMCNTKDVESFAELVRADERENGQQKPASVTYKEVTDAMNALYAGDLKQVQIAMEMGSKKLYTSPPAQRTWVGLTEADWKHLYDEFAMGQELDEFAEAIEAKLKEKNT